MHGANRLGANSLLDIVVFGRACANRIGAALWGGRVGGVGQGGVGQGGVGHLVCCRGPHHLLKRWIQSAGYALSAPTCPPSYLHPCNPFPGEIAKPNAPHKPLAADAGEGAIARLDKLRNAKGGQTTAQIRRRMQKARGRVCSGSGLGEGCALWAVAKARTSNLSSQPRRFAPGPPPSQVMQSDAAVFRTQSSLEEGCKQIDDTAASFKDVKARP